MTKIRSFKRIWSYLLKKSLMDYFEILSKFDFNMATTNNTMNTAKKK